MALGIHPDELVLDTIPKDMNDPYADEPQPTDFCPHCGCAIRYEGQYELNAEHREIASPYGEVCASYCNFCDECIGAWWLYQPTYRWDEAMRRGYTEGFNIDPGVESKIVYFNEIAKDGSLTFEQKTRLISRFFNGK